MIISHINAHDFSLQSNEDHCKNVARLASKFASEFGFNDWGTILGLLHDKGKEQKDFQIYIQSVTGYNSDNKDYTHVNHAYVGAILARNYYPHCYPILSYAIMGHHSGLCDYPNFNQTITSSLPNDIIGSRPTMDLSIPSEFVNHCKKRTDINHLIRILFSCLVDADFLDTENFMNTEKSKSRGTSQSIEHLLPILEEYLDNLKSQGKASPINKIRNEIQAQCLKFANHQPGFYSLTVPTGGGKTLSSLLWAMRHAVCHGKKRIIIAIPYTSIITQTAAILRSIFGDMNVLEHHSDNNITDSDDCLNPSQMKLATENWDAPIVVTTNVQLFESLYANKSSKCRKLHNIANSVLILDEAQTISFEYLQPIVDALDAYRRLFNVSVLFTTASQPVLVGRHQGGGPDILFSGFDNITEIIPKSFNLAERLKRVELHIISGQKTHEDVAKLMLRYPKVLCIVNTRKDAQKIFSQLPQIDKTIHLSRMMCSAHIRETIEYIKQSLKDDNTKTIRVVATQLIEAGVDVDFPVVMRQEAGLDSILQAAGRCNREGAAALGSTFVFSLGTLPSGFFQRTNNARKAIPHSIDWLSEEAMNEYFKQLYFRTQSFDIKNIENMLDIPDFQFKNVSEQFKLIEDNGVSIIVNYGNAMDLIQQINPFEINKRLMHQLNQYSVTVKERDFRQLQKAGLIIEKAEGLYYLPDKQQYDSHVGLMLDSHWLDEILIK